MTTIKTITGLHGKLKSLRDWDWPEDREAFDRALCRKVAVALGRSGFLHSMWRVHSRNPASTTHEVMLGTKTRGASFSPLATVYVTTG
jgi:hypothetical protein